MKSAIKSNKFKFSKLNFSTKKAVDLPMGLIITLIVMLLILVIMVTFTTMFTREVDRTSNIQAVKSWVMKENLVHDKTKQLSTIFTKQSSPPVSPLSEPIQINSKNQIYDENSKDYAKKLIADAMIDCWSAFGNGKIDFLPAESSFCYPCTGIKIADAVKEEIKKTGKTTLPYFNQYLANTRPLGGKDSKTYWEMLGGGNIDLTSMTETYEINLMEDQYIFFGARKGGVSWNKVLTYGGVAAGVGATAGVIGITAGVIGTGGLLLVPIAAGAVVTAVAGKNKLDLDKKEQFYPILLIGPPKIINDYCNIKNKEELKAEKEGAESLEKTQKTQMDLFNEIKTKIDKCYEDNKKEEIKAGEVKHCNKIDIDLPDKYWIAFDSRVNPHKMLLIKGESPLNASNLIPFEVKYFAPETTAILPSKKGLLYGFNRISTEDFNYMNEYWTSKKTLDIYTCGPGLSICLTQYPDLKI